jgi:hypothetical protein
MSVQSDSIVIYHRSKAIAIGLVLMGYGMLVLAYLVLTEGQVGGLHFSRDMAVMSTWLLLPLGLVLIAAHTRHAVSAGPTVSAGPEGVTIHFASRGTILLQWPEIKAFRPFTHQGRWQLGIVLEDPKSTLPAFAERKSMLINRHGSREIHLAIEGRMLDQTVHTVAHDLEEMRQIHSWRA